MSDMDDGNEPQEKPPDDSQSTPIAEEQSNARAKTDIQGEPGINQDIPLKSLQPPPFVLLCLVLHLETLTSSRSPSSRDKKSCYRCNKDTPTVPGRNLVVCLDGTSNKFGVKVRYYSGLLHSIYCADFFPEYQRSRVLFSLERKESILPSWCRHCPYPQILDMENNQTLGRSGLCPVSVLVVKPSLLLTSCYQFIRSSRPAGVQVVNRCI